MKFNFVQLIYSHKMKTPTSKKQLPSFLFIPLTIFLSIIPLIWNESIMDASLNPRLLAISIFIPILLFLTPQKKINFLFSRPEKVVFGGLLLFITMHPIATINAINIHEAVYYTIKELVFCTWFFLIYQFVQSNTQNRNALIYSLSLMSCIFIGIGIYQLCGADFSEFRNATTHLSYYWDMVMENIYSNCSNKNLFASLLFLSFPILCYMALTTNKSKILKVVLYIICVINVLFIVLTLSRGALAAILATLFIAYILFGVYLLKIRRRIENKAPSRKELLILGMPVLIACIVLLGALVTETQIEKTIKERVMLTITPEKYGYKSNESGESSVAMRTIIWKKTMQLIGEHPVIGSGPGQWQLNIPKFGVDEFNSKIRNGSLTYQRPHNDYLWFASEVGLLGLLGYLLFYFGAIAISVINIFKANDKKIIVFNIIATASLIGYTIIAFLDVSHERIEHNILYLSVIALVITDYRQTINASQKPLETKWARYIYIGVFVLISVFAVNQAIQHMKGERLSRDLLNSYYREKWDIILRKSKGLENSSYTIDPLSTPLLYFKGVALNAKNDTTAIDAINKALEWNPYHLKTLNLAGNYYMNHKNYDKAIECYNNLFAYSSRFDQALYNSSVCYQHKKDYQKSFEYFVMVPFKISSQIQGYRAYCQEVCKQYAITIKDKYNAEKFELWINNPKKIYNTYYRFCKEEATNFDEFLLDELGNAN